MNEQLSFLCFDDTESVVSKIETLEKKIENIRKGLFKRYEESKKAIEFLEGELQDLMEANIKLFGTYQ